MGIREIEDKDLPDVLALLVEGFPRRRPTYWQRGLQNMRLLPEVPGFPRYGYLLEENGAAEGLILLLSTRTDDASVRANNSCWYVREAHRAKAAILYKRATSGKGVQVNYSPAEHVVPIAQACGFRPYSSGVCLIDGRAALRPAHGWRVTRYAPSRIDVPLSLIEIAERHLHYGCKVLVLENGTAPVELIVYRMKLIKGIVPCAQFLHGLPEHLLAASGPLMRHLVMRGILLALVDIEETTDTIGFRRYPGLNVRYAKGGTPAIGDLVDSEYAIFGP
jgi:hypothetical protein